jgi:hypothetical protein
VSAVDPEIALLEGRCPVCGTALLGASSASAVIGYRWFDLRALGEEAPSEEPDARGRGTAGSAGYPGGPLSRSSSASAARSRDSARSDSR